MENVSLKVPSYLSSLYLYVGVLLSTNKSLERETLNYLVSGSLETCIPHNLSHPTLKG